jgi:cytosine/adenosine deaminase-related metal-dependent hydrolase
VETLGEALGSGVLRLRATFALVGRDLEASRDVCVEVEDGFVVSVRRGCSSGGYVRVSAVAPLAANAHMHSADYLFPEYGSSMRLEELVAPPRGLKHRLLEAAPRSRIIEASAAAYRAAEARGVGLIVDFREPAAGGCAAGREAASRVYGVARVILLGRPGDPGGPSACDGVGLNSPLDHPEGLPGGWEAFELRAAHVAETREARGRGDFEAALRIGVRVLVHGVHLSRRDLEEAAAEGLWLVLCPRSNMWHCVGLPPVRGALEAGVRVALGSDNAAWSLPDPRLDAAEALRIARLQGARGPGVARWVLRALYIGGYEMAGEEAPVIEEGSRAAFAVYLLGGEEEWALSAAVDPYSAAVKTLAYSPPAAVVRGDRVLCRRAAGDGGLTPCRGPGLLSS